MLINPNSAYHACQDGGYRLDKLSNTITLSILQRAEINQGAHGAVYIPEHYATVTLGADCMKDLIADLKRFYDQLFPKG